MQRDHRGWRRRLVGEGPALAARTALPVRTVLGILAFLLVWRLAILVFSYTADAAGPGSCGWGQPTLLKYSACWDSAFYLSIAEHGYRVVDGDLVSIAFFPLYPLLIGLVDWLLPGNAGLAGLIVGHMALAGATFYIYRLFQLEFDDDTAWRTLWFLLVFPSALFLTAIYAEPLLLFGLAGMLFHARRGHWLRAGLFAAPASGTKAVGVLAIVPLVVEAVAQGAIQRRDVRSLVGIALAPLGALAYLAYLQVRFGDFRLFLEAEATYWLRESRELVVLPALRRLLYGDMDYALTFYPETISSLPSFHLLTDTVFLLLFALAGIILWLKVRPTYGAFVLAFAVLFAFSGSTQSLNRYVIVLFPAFLLPARVQSERVRDAISVVSVLWLGLTIYLFVNGRWAG